MEFERCNNCRNELPFSASSNKITCPVCGTIHIKKGRTFQLPTANKSNSVDASAATISVSFESDSGGDC